MCKVFKSIEWQFIDKIELVEEKLLDDTQKKSWSVFWFSGTLPWPYLFHCDPLIDFFFLVSRDLQPLLKNTCALPERIDRQVPSIISRSNVPRKDRITKFSRVNRGIRKNVENSRRVIGWWYSPTWHMSIKRAVFCTRNIGSTPWILVKKSEYCFNTYFGVAGFLSDSHCTSLHLYLRENFSQSVDIRVT